MLGVHLPWAFCRHVGVKSSRKKWREFETNVTSVEKRRSSFYPPVTVYKRAQQKLHAASSHRANNRGGGVGVGVGALGRCKKPPLSRYPTHMRRDSALRSTRCYRLSLRDIASCIYGFLNRSIYLGTICNYSEASGGNCGRKRNRNPQKILQNSSLTFTKY